MSNICIYLRKSRADEEIERMQGEGETLAKHRKALLKYAKEKQFNIIEIKEEIVSGDSLFNRPKMLELLKEVEEKQYEGVLVMDIDRLGRGGMKDQGIILDAFKESNTKIITPLKTYDLNNDLDEEMTEFKTFFSRRELKTINRRMQGGRIRSIEDGNYIATNAPYGYDIEYVNKSRLLKVNETECEIVKIIFNRYIDGDGAGTIANYLNSLGYKTKCNGAFNASSILFILRNPIYIGKITWKKREYKKSMDPNKIKDCRTRDKKEWLISDGKHEAIIDEKLFNKANSILASKYHAPYKQNNPPVNPFAGILICPICNRAIVMRKYNGIKRILCPRKCANMSMRFDEFEPLALKAIEGYMTKYEAEIIGKQDVNKKESSIKQISIMKKELSALNSQKMNLFDLLERKLYSEELFLQRSKNIDERITNLNNELIRLNKIVNTESKETKLKNISLFKNVLVGYKKATDVRLKNELLRSIIEKIEYTKLKHEDEINIDIRIVPKLLR